jgi:hypothetical protein
VVRHLGFRYVVTSQGGSTTSYQVHDRVQYYLVVSLKWQLDFIPDGTAWRSEKLPRNSPTARPGRKRRSGCQAPCAPIRQVHTKTIYCGKRRGSLSAMRGPGR